MSRDIKSSNIMIVANKWIKLIDFGMAKRLFVNAIGHSHSTSTIVGTVSSRKLNVNFTFRVD